MMPQAYTRLVEGDELIGSQCFLCREPFVAGDIPIPVRANSYLSAPAHWRCTEKGKSVMAGTPTLSQRVDWFTGTPDALAEEIHIQIEAGWEVTAMTTTSLAPTDHPSIHDRRDVSKSTMNKPGNGDAEAQVTNEYLTERLTGKTVEAVWDAPAGGIALVFTDGTLVDIRQEKNALRLRFFRRDS
jgi:hypothetical protein